MITESISPDGSWLGPIENLEQPHVTVDATHDAIVAEGGERQRHTT
jgi:hypothetical protein